MATKAKQLFADATNEDLEHDLIVAEREGHTKYAHSLQMELNRRNGVKRTRKPKAIPLPPLPDQLWAMAYNTHNALGSISHVSHGEKFFRTEEECQTAIDSMEGWIGMGDRSRYRPLLLVSGEKK